MEGGIRRLSWSWDSTLLLALLAWAYPLSISTQHYVCGPPLLYQRGGMEASVSAFHSSPPSSFFKELGRLRLTLFATDNMYADMEVPFHVTVKVEDAASDELISGAYVVVRAEYFGGDGEPWVENFTATEDPPPPPGYYSAFIHHTGAGLYNFTAFVWTRVMSRLWDGLPESSSRLEQAGLFPPLTECCYRWPYYSS